MNKKFYEPVYLKGNLLSDFMFSHTNHLESYYRTRISVHSADGNEQYNLIIPEHLVDVTASVSGLFVRIFGEVRAFPGREREALNTEDACYVYVNSISGMEMAIA